MHYVLMDSGGNLVDSYSDRDEAVDALRAIVAEEPDAADDIAVLEYDEHGNPTGEPVQSRTLFA